MIDFQLMTGLIIAAFLLSGVVAWAMWRHKPTDDEEWGEDWAP
jgi:hypothetical protein